MKHSSKHARQAAQRRAIFYARQLWQAREEKTDEVVDGISPQQDLEATQPVQDVT